MYKSTVRFEDGSSWDTNFVIKARDSHAFPEVYISGYGWVSFEPTIAADAEADNTAENLNVMRYGFIMLGIALIVFLIWLLLPTIREKQFRRSLQKLTAEEGASAIFCRMRKILKMPDSTTVNEVAAASAPFFDEPELYAALDRKLYSTEPAASPAETAEAYIRWQEAQKQYAKEQKRLAREQRRAERLARKNAT
ncbi:MAG: transglutaminase domain-containing protein, partial [Oscillospiraceae bacterium]|nr:transglutaminase domain-containing protein [Oscillospiraceae bacterium]